MVLLYSAATIGIRSVLPPGFLFPYSAAAVRVRLVSVSNQTKADGSWRSRILYLQPSHLCLRALHWEDQLAIFGQSLGISCSLSSMDLASTACWSYQNQTDSDMGCHTTTRADLAARQDFQRLRDTLYPPHSRFSVADSLHRFRGTCSMRTRTCSSRELWTSGMESTKALRGSIASK